jgi:hypothetical protein
MQLSAEDMLQKLRDRTHLLNNDPYLLDELNTAGDWVFNQIMVMDEDIMKAENEQFTIAAQTSSYDLGANVAKANMYAIKWLGVKLAGDTKFNPVQWMDSAKDLFMSADQDQPATAHPIYCDTKNFSQVRFAPALPAGAVIRVDYIYCMQLMDLDTNAALSSSAYTGIPNPFNQAIVHYATGLVMTGIDDLRDMIWERRAKEAVRVALNVLDKRQWQQIPKVKGFSRHTTRRVF